MVKEQMVTDGKWIDVRGIDAVNVQWLLVCVRQGGIPTGLSCRIIRSIFMTVEGYASMIG